jgi:hypothetical protein
VSAVKQTDRSQAFNGSQPISGRKFHQVFHANVVPGYQRFGHQPRTPARQPLVVLHRTTNTATASISFGSALNTSAHTVHLPVIPDATLHAVNLTLSSATHLFIFIPEVLE